MVAENRKTILLVEDEAILAMTGKMTLEKNGYTVLMAGSGEQALDLFHGNGEIHLVLMDIDLGEGMDGTECASHMLAERNVPVVFLSSHTEPEVVEKTEKITSYGYVVKNSGSTVLFASINMAFKLFEATMSCAEAEGKLNKSYLLLKSSIESPQDMIILSIDRDYNYLYFNSYHKRVMLAAYGTDVQPGMNLIACMSNADDIRKARIHYDRALAGESHITIEEYGDQERYWFETRFNPVLDEEGRVIGATAFSSNVTARILGENKLKEALAEAQRLRDMTIDQTRIIRETEQRYRALFENNHIVMLIIDPADGRIGDANQAAADFYGWPRETLVQMQISQINTLSADEIRDEMARAVAEKIKTYHFCHRKADGTVVDVDVYSGTIELDGKIWLLSVIHDMTEKLSAIKEKEDLTKRLSHYLATSPTITYSVRFYDKKDHWQWVSENAAGILGYSTDEIMHEDWWFDNLHPLDRPRVLSAIAKLSSESSLSLEYRFLRKNRTWLWLRDEKRWTTSVSGDLEIVGSLTDISECKELEEELLLKSSALEFTVNPVMISDISGAIQWVNKAFENFTGYSISESIGRNPKELLGSGKQNDVFYRNMWATILSGKSWNGTIVNRKKNGELCTVEMSITPVPDENGRIFHFIAVTNDITDRIRAERHLKKFELLLRSSIESAKDMIILSIDSEYRYLYFNSCHRKVMAAVYGTNAGIGKNLLDCITNDDDRRKAKINYDKALAGESHITVEEFGDLERSFYETRYNPILDDKNRVIGATAFSVDITERERARVIIEKQQRTTRSE